MDPRLFEFYEREWNHLLAVGAEFADEFPKIALRLRMSDDQVADPLVERLLQGVAFLSARVQLKMDAEFPRFTQSLLELIYPNYLAPTPAMLIAQFLPNLRDPSLASGRKIVPRGSELDGPRVPGSLTRPRFTTGHDVTLWPIELTDVRYFSHAPDLPRFEGDRGGLRLTLRATAGLSFSQIKADSLRFYVHGDDAVANRVHELCVAAPAGVQLVTGTAGSRHCTVLPAERVLAVGFDDAEGLLPVSPVSSQGFRLLQEYFACPQRFRFFEITGLAGALAAADTREVELVVRFSRGDASLETAVGPSTLALFCAPAVNLFPRDLDEVHVTESEHEYHLVPERERPLDFEIHHLTNVASPGAPSERQEFRPFYAAYHGDERGRHPAYYVVRREPRLLPLAQRRRQRQNAPGTASLSATYVGTEMFLSLVDPMSAPFRLGLGRLHVSAVCSNRDLPRRMPTAGDQALELGVGAPVVGTRILKGPTTPRSPLADGAVAWRAVSHLSRNYLSITDAPAGGQAAALRDLLDLYVPPNDAALKRQVEGIRSVTVRPVVRRLPHDGHLTFGRGLEITLEVDDMPFEGRSAFLLGSVLERVLSRQVSVNAFTETVLRTQDGRDIHRWRPRCGSRPIL